MNKSKLIFLSTLTVTFSAVIFSCTKDSGKNPTTPTTTTTTTGSPVVNACDTITYAKHIKPIITAECLSCHGDNSPSGGFPLTSYEAVKGKAESGRIEARVIKGQAPGFMPVPPQGPLPQAKLDLISCWLKNGYKP